mgnify:CR=1 FL=1|jgi:hypothetical protein
MATYYAETGTLVDEWSVEDVQVQRPDLTWEQAANVLQSIATNYNAEVGMNWEVIDCVAQIKYPEEIR